MDGVGSEPTVLQAPAPTVCVAGAFTATPAGVILHGSRSGMRQATAAEFRGTVSYIEGGALDAEGDNLGWNATVGEDIVALHIGPKHWGWNARGHSSVYEAVEFAQPTVDDAISDGQVRTFVWWFLHVARAAWPDLPAVFPLHSELAAGIKDGKSDAFPRHDPRGNDLKARIRIALGGG